MTYASAVFNWDEGARRLRDAPDRLRPALELVRDRLVDELRRRLGSAFTVEELAALYARGTDWCLELAVSIVPDQPAAWDPAVADAAFGAYAREAADFAGGERRERGEDER